MHDSKQRRARVTGNKRKASKWLKFISIGIVLLIVGGIILWQSIDRYKEVQQIESKLGFDIKVVKRDSPDDDDIWWAASRTYRVKPVEAEKGSTIEYLLYLNKENKIEQWAKLENGKIIKPIHYEDM